MGKIQSATGTYMCPRDRDLYLIKKARYDKALTYAKLGLFDKIDSDILIKHYENLCSLHEDYMDTNPVTFVREGINGLELK